MGPPGGTQPSDSPHFISKPTNNHQHTILTPTLSTSPYPSDTLSQSITQLIPHPHRYTVSPNKRHANTRPVTSLVSPKQPPHPTAIPILSSSPLSPQLLAVLGMFENMEEHVRESYLLPLTPLGLRGPVRELPGYNSGNPEPNGSWGFIVPNSSWRVALCFWCIGMTANIIAVGGYVGGVRSCRLEEGGRGRGGGEARRRREKHTIDACVQEERDAKGEVGLGVGVGGGAGI